MKRIDYDYMSGEDQYWNEPFSLSDAYDRFQVERAKGFALVALAIVVAGVCVFAAVMAPDIDREQASIQWEVR